MATATPPNPELKTIAPAVATAVDAMIAAEESSLPFQVADILKRRLPRILFFDHESRDLRSTYDLTAEAKSPPQALANLARLAKLDIKKLARAASDKDRAHVQELLNAANALLKKAFENWWIRDDVAPAFHADGAVLHIQVTTPEGGLSVIDERSDGLRWFISLVAFLSGHKGEARPIILVDEAERHLSYDAQASLMGFLNRRR